MTEQEATSQALADGITQAQINPSILAFYGYTAPAPTAGITVGQVVAPQEVTDSINALAAEAKSNSLPSAIIGEVTTILGWAKNVGLLTALGLMLCLIISGCSTDAAQREEKNRQTTEKALNAQHLAFEEGVIQYYVANETARINQLYNDALASATVAGNIPVTVANALSTQKARALSTMTQRVADMRAQQAQIQSNAVVLELYAQGMEAYFTNSAANFTQLQTAQAGILQFLQNYITPATAAPAK